MRGSRGRRLLLLIAGSALAVGAWSVQPAGAAEPPPRSSGGVGVAMVHNCPASGQPNLELWDGYGSWETPAVRRAQCLLNWALNPWDYPALDVDGEFGPLTEARVYDFQECMVYGHGHNISIDGEIGRQTWPLLERWAADPDYWAC